MDLASERSYPTAVANSTLLPLLLFSLMRQKNSPTISGLRREEYDYIIVGAGSAGATLAARLSEEPCVNVLLLEAGKSPPLVTEVPAFTGSFWIPSDINWNYKTVPQRHAAEGLVNRQMPWRNGKVLGGTSIINGMVYARGNRKNYDDWAAKGAKGWSYNEVLPYFKKMEDNKNLRDLDPGYHDRGGPLTVETPNYHPEIKSRTLQAVKQMGYRLVDPNGINETGFYDVQLSTKRAQRCSTAKAYLVPAENRLNLDILNNAQVLKVIFEGDRAAGVVFKYMNITHTVRAKSEVILSAGTVNSAQLMMLSGIGPRSHLEEFNIPVVADLPVGDNLHDHCSTNLNYYLNPDQEFIGAKLKKPQTMDEYIRYGKGPFTTPLLLVAFLDGDIVKPDIDLPNVELFFVEGQTSIYKYIYGLKPELYKQVFEPYEDKPFYLCTPRGLQPRSRGTIRLNSSDPLDPPLIDPNYFADRRDVEDLVKGMKVCNRIASSEQLRTLGSKPFQTILPNCKQYINDEDSYLECQARTITIPTNHQVGTAKMGDPDDPTTVVDPQLRVKGVKGLRVVDASIMPVVPTGNTNAPVIMVAEKAADIIKTDIVCPLNDC